MPTSAPDCPFCQIVAGTDCEVREVYRNDEVVVFFPTDPATLGHTMVVPTRHVETITGLTNAEAARIAMATTQLARDVQDAFEPDGMNVIQSNGAVAEQTVPHVHVHVVPRWKNDIIGPIWPTETSYTEAAKDDALSALADRVQQHVDVWDRLERGDQET